jgi:hypothetical protein
MPDVTPNLGLVLSRYEDQEHLEYNANWKALDAASFQTFTVGVNPDALPFTASMTTDALSSSPIWASAVNNVLFFGRSTLSLVNQAAIVSLDVSGLSALVYLDCDTNQLTTLDVSGLSALVYLECYTNQLTTLDVSGLSALVYLDCYTNQLTTLDVSGLSALAYLGCDTNQLTTLDVSGLSALVYLDCDTNQLTTLDVSGLSALVYLDCDTNQLTLDAVNGILAALVANGQANGYLNMSGGTNASPTDSADEATLLANGWTVTTN